MTEQDTPKMTHDEMIDVLKGLVFGTFDRTTAKEREALDMAISALSTDGEYIKKSELLQHVTTEVLSDYQECDVIHAEVIDELPTYSIPDSAKTQFIEKSNFDMEQYKADLDTAYECGNQFYLSAIEKIRAEIAELEDGISSYFHDRPWIFKDEALAVIDKYIGGKDK